MGAMTSQTASEEQKRRFLTVEQVAEELNVGLPLVRGLLKTGELRGFQVGGRGMWRVGSQDLEDYLSRAYKATAERIAAGDIADEDGVE
jgi:prophage regulatory protein